MLNQKNNCASCKLIEHSLLNSFDVIAFKNSKHRRELDDLIAIKMKRLDELGTYSTDKTDPVGRTRIGAGVASGDYRVEIKRLQKEINELLVIQERENDEFKRKLNSHKEYIHRQFHRVRVSV